MVENESKASKILSEEYSRLAWDYEENVAPRFRELIPKFLASSELGSKSHVLDIGTGTGIVGRVIRTEIPNIRTIVGVDVALGMLRVARQKSADPGKDVFLLMSGLNLGFKEGSFDTVISTFGIPDLGFEKAISEAYKVLKKDGRLLLLEWGSPDALTTKFYSILARYKTKKPSDRLRKVRAAMASHDEVWQRLREPTSRKVALEEAGFRDVNAAWSIHHPRFANSAEVSRFYTSWGPIRAEMEEIPQVNLEKIEEELAIALVPGSENPFVVTWEMIHFTGIK